MSDYTPYCPFCGSYNLKITIAGYGEKTVGYVAVFAAHLILKCATEHGDAEAPRMLADLYFAGWGDAGIREIMRLFVLAAQRGNKNADTGIAQNKRTLVCCAIGST